MPTQILVVDDDPDLSLLMALFLRKHGHQVDTAADGRAALEKIRTSAPDLVVLDWNMPHLDGLGLAAAVRGELGLTGLPLLMVTAIRNKLYDLLDNFIEGGNDRFVTAT